MSIPLTPTFLGLIVALFLVAGAINGLAGFGFALVGTMVLAIVIEPAVAVVFVIVPILAVNLSLIGELSADDLRTCGRRFTPLLVAALLGTVLGMVVLDRLPTAPLRVGLGVITLAFVLSLQSAVEIPGLARAKAGCFVESRLAMIGVGGVSGFLFGGTNVGVQLVAYLRSCDLSHGLFVGVVAMVFLGLNGIRVVAAGALGLYPDLITVGLSIAAAVPAVLGVAAGRQLRSVISERARKAGVLVLLTVIGVRLVASGLGLF